MRYEEITPTLRTFIGTWETFRLLGYSADSLYFLAAKSVKLGGALGAFCVLRTQGLEFAVDCGPIPSAKKARAEYVRVVTAISRGTLPEDDLARIWKESEACQRKVELMIALFAKGFVLPRDLPS